MTSIRVRLLKWLIGPVQLAFDDGLGDTAAGVARTLRARHGFLVNVAFELAPLATASCCAT